MIKDDRHTRKEKVLHEMRNELKEIERVKRTPKGRREFLLKWMDDTFLKEKKRGINE